MNLITSFAFSIALVAVPPAHVWVNSFKPILEAPTWTSKVLVALATIVNHWPLTGSVDLGYVWFVAFPSLVQVNTKESSLILILSPIAKLWPPDSNCKIPVDAL